MFLNKKNNTLMIMQQFSSLILFFLLLCFGGGVLIYFLAGEPLLYRDWSCIQLYTDIFKVAFKEGVLPFILDQTSFNYGYTHSRNFLAYPQHWITPDILLAYIFSLEKAVIFHTLCVYIIGNLFLLWYARKSDWPLTVLWLVFLLFNLNGYIFHHMAVGHFNWNSCYLLFVFMVILIKLQNFSWNVQFHRLIVFLLSFLFSFMIFSGSIYIVLYCFLFFFFNAIFNKKVFFPFIIVTLLTFCSAAVFIFPTLAYQKGYSVICGYPNLTVLIDAFTVNHKISYQVQNLGGWWEYSIYIGFSGFFVLSFLLLYYFFYSYKQSQLNFLVLPCAILFLLSLGFIEKIFSISGLPGSNALRVPSRLIILPFTASLFIISVSLKHLISKYKNLIKFLFIINIFITWEMLLAIKPLALTKLNKAWTKPELIVSFSEQIPFLYKIFFYTGLFISLITTLYIIFNIFMILKKNNFIKQFFIDILRG